MRAKRLKSGEGGSPLSVRAYARRRGCSDNAVRQAIRAGRLKRSIVRDAKGRAKIADPELADQEWAATTHADRVPLTGPTAPRGAPRPATEAPDDLNLAEESAREKFWKARIAELDYLERAGELVDAKAMGAQLVDTFTKVRTRLLGLPTRAKQQLPHLTVTDIGTIDTIVREALEELAAPEVGAEEPKEAANG